LNFFLNIFVLNKGKPGGGAPRLDNSGQLNNKIAGKLWWNLSKQFWNLEDFNFYKIKLLYWGY